MTATLRARCRAWIAALAHRAGRAHVAGGMPADGVAVCRRYAARGFATSLGFWNRGGEPPLAIAATHLAALELLREPALDCTLSVKAPALGWRRDLFAEVLSDAARAGVAVHLDALAPRTAGATFTLLEESRDACPPLGCTLPGRWERSVRDADWVRERDLAVRVVKGQWPDPDLPGLDPRAGFLAVIDRLAGRAGVVRVATHDTPLGEEALRRLTAAGTPCEWELLVGLPAETPLRAARRAGVRVRFYVPYGHAHLPYRLRDGLRDARIGWWLVRDLASGCPHDPMTPVPCPNPEP